MRDAGGYGKADRVSPGVVLWVKEVLVVLALALLCGLFLELFVLEAYSIPTPSMEGTLLRGDYVLVNKLVYGLRTPRTVPFTSLRLPSVSLPGISRPAPGDVVVFELLGGLRGNPHQNPVSMVKRCIGGPGHTVEIRDGIVRVNGQRLPLSHAYDGSTSPVEQSQHVDDFGPVVVPAAGSRLFLSPSTLEQWRGLIEDEGHIVDRNLDGSILIDGRSTNEYEVTRNYYFMLGDNLINSIDSRTIGYVPEGRITGKVFFVYWSSDVQSNRGGLGSLLNSIRWFRIGTIVR